MVSESSSFRLDTNRIQTGRNEELCPVLFYEKQTAR